MTTAAERGSGDFGSMLKAGTNCGSCRAEIKAIIQANHVEAAE